MQWGGLKVCIDHGDGLFTVSCHLARALVEPGDDLGRGEIVGLSGMSGTDGVLAFPWLSPHLHYTVVLDGEVADPFARAGEEPLWRGGNQPTPHTGEPDRAFEPTRFSADGMRTSIEACRDPRLRSRLTEIQDDYERGVAILLAWLITPPLFTDFPGFHAEPHARSAHLDLPFSAEDFDGIALPG